MRRHVFRWAGWPLGLLAVSALVGQCAREDLDPPAAPTAVAPAPFGAQVDHPEAVRSDVLTRGPDRFGPPAVPDADARGQYLAAVRAAVAELHSPSPDFGNTVRSSPAGSDVFDLHRTAEEWGPLGAFPLLGPPPTNRSLATEAEDARQALRRLAAEPPWGYGSDRVEIVSASTATAGPVVRVLARHRAAPGGVEHTWYVRWWLAPGDRGGWRVYDLDEPGSRLRFTVRRAGDAAARARVVAAAEPAGAGGGQGGDGPGEPPGVSAAARDGLVAAADGDRLAVRLAADRLPADDLIPALDAVRLTLVGLADLLADKPASALASFDAALRRWEDTPPAVLGRAAALTRLGRPDEALRAVAEYRSLVGNDPVAWREEARAKAARGDAAGAAAALAAGLAESPGDLPLLVELLARLPADRAKEAGEAAAQGIDPGATLTALVARTEADPVERVAAVVAGFRAARPRDPVGMWEDAAVKLRQGKRADAARLVKDAWERSPADARESPAAGVVARAVRAGKAADGYAAVAAVAPALAVRTAGEGLEEAFEVAGPDAPDGKAALAALAEITAAHTTAHPADPWGDYYAAKAARFAGDLPAADRRLAAGLGKLPRPVRLPPDVRWVRDPMAEGYDPAWADWEAFRHERADVLFALGRWKQAYEELPPAGETFEQLAGLLERANDGAGLIELAHRHRAAAPGDPEATAVLARGHWLRREYERAAAEAGAYLGRVGDDAPRRAVATEERVRSLVRLGRPADAKEIAGRLFLSPESLGVNERVAGVPADTAFLLRAIVLGAGGDADGLRGMLADNSEAARWAGRFYADPDIGPTLRTPAFAAFRKSYPPPGE
jgi:tetratricopeptide (TPR) repeat protein